MGQHTWFAKRVERDFETAQSYVIQSLERSVELTTEMFNNPNHDIRVAYEKTDNDLLRQIAIFERQLKMVKKGLCKVAIMNRQPEHSRYNSRGFFIFDDNLPHDIFRIWCNPSFGFPYNMYCPVELFSKQETYDFLEEQKRNEKEGREHWIVPSLDSEQFDRLDEFWNNHPDGMISFG